MIPLGVTKTVMSATRQLTRAVVRTFSNYGPRPFSDKNVSLKNSYFTDLYNRTLYHTKDAESLEYRAQEFADYKTMLRNEVKEYHDTIEKIIKINEKEFGNQSDFIKQQITQHPKEFRIEDFKTTGNNYDEWKIRKEL